MLLGTSVGGLRFISRYSRAEWCRDGPRTRPNTDAGGKDESAPKEAGGHGQGTIGDGRTELDDDIRRTSRAAAPRLSHALGGRAAAGTSWD
jgi:hypothetical protein